MEYLVNFMIIVLVYLIPLAFYLRNIKRSKYSILINILISILYFILIFIVPAMIANILPFILIMISIYKMKNENRYESNFLTYGFSIENFNISKALLYSFVNYFLLVIPVSLVTQVIMKAFGLMREQQEVVQLLYNYDLIKLILVSPSLVIFAPIVEEFVFRYILFSKLLRVKLKGKVGFIISASIVSFIFAIVHYNGAAIGVLFAISFFNCYLVENKGFWYAVFNHFIVNAITTTLIFVSKLAL